MKLMYIPKSKSQQNPPDFIFRSQKPSPHNPEKDTAATPDKPLCRKSHELGGRGGLTLLLL